VVNLKPPPPPPGRRRRGCHAGLVSRIRQRGIPGFSPCLGPSAKRGGIDEHRPTPSGPTQVDASITDPFFGRLLCIALGSGYLSLSSVMKSRLRWFL
jgi:hypothetical protein